MQKQLEYIDQLQKQWHSLKNVSSNKITTCIEIEYTYESNKIEGNTLTLNETALVIEKGITIGGKTLVEHLEAINHSHAITYIKSIVTDEIDLHETILLNIHKLILTNIDNKNAGSYRKVQVMISGAKHIPPQPYLVQKQMEDFFIWFVDNKKVLHPVMLAALVHLKLVSIHPFIDGNGRTSRLLMNLILLQNKYPITILKGDIENKIEYYNALETAQVEHNEIPFTQLIINTVQNNLERMISILS